MILQIEHTIDGFMKLELGKYSKMLEDRFAELLATNKKINATLRPNVFKEPNVSTDILETLTINPLKIVINKRASSGGLTIGFGTPINIRANPMGFSGAAVVTTQLYEELL